ncbi:zinc finger protein 652-like isoform X1 [Tribolium castaneum]|uniref:zinc finger protein 652-like isoform X1 n=1 Tax=Tribolium castaneum TaxID=7070 RepID=UPI0030FE62A2
MHGGIENVDPVKELTAGDIIDSGAVDHSSDSDYEPPVSVESFTKSSSDIKVKMEPSGESGGSDRPNILRKKPSNPDALKVKEEPSMHLQPMVARQDSLFSCMVCQGEETVAGDVRAITAHMKNVHDIRLYICDVCGQDFRKRNELSAHLDEHVAAEEGDFQCEVCNRIFSNLRLFRIHRRMHYPQNKAWACETCGKKYSSRNLLEEHINTHRSPTLRLPTMRQRFRLEIHLQSTRKDPRGQAATLRLQPVPQVLPEPAKPDTARADAHRDQRVQLPFVWQEVWFGAQPRSPLHRAHGLQALRVLHLPQSFRS